MEIVEERYNREGVKLQGQPDIEGDMEEYWVGFWHLNNTRQIGFGAASGISYTEMIAYCDINEIVGEDRDDFIHFITLMDGVFKKMQSEKAEEQRARSKGR